LDTCQIIFKYPLDTAKGVSENLYAYPFVTAKSLKKSLGYFPAGLGIR
jgi:hypothetical protein